MSFPIEKKQKARKLQLSSEQKKTVPGCLGNPLAPVYKEELEETDARQMPDTCWQRENLA